MGDGVMGLEGMQGASLVEGFFLRFIEGRQQQRQKRHVVAQGQAAHIAVGLPQHPAQAAIKGAEAMLFILRKRLGIDGNVAKHAFIPSQYIIRYQRLSVNHCKKLIVF